MLYSCDLENYRQLWWWKEKSTRRRDERVAWPKRQMMLATRVIHINRVFLYLTFERMKLHNQNGRVSIVDIEEILFFNVVSLVLRTGFEDACYEHILLVKSREDNQWIQLKKRCWLRGLFLHRARLFNILFGWHSAREEWWAPYCCLFHALKVYLYPLSFHMTAFALFLLYRLKILPIVVSIVF